MIEIYDNGGETLDRYGERTTFESLPEEVQRAIEYRRRP